jgi:hypothetical protein
VPIRGHRYCRSRVLSCRCYHAVWRAMLGNRRCWSFSRAKRMRGQFGSVSRPGGADGTGIVQSHAISVQIPRWRFGLESLVVQEVQRDGRPTDARDAPGEAPAASA